MEIISDIITFIVGLMLTYLITSHRKEKRKREMYHMKVDCIIYGLRSVNHGIGTEFGSAYDARFDELKKETDFIEK